MFYWIYDIPTLLVIGLFSAVFIGVCWLGIDAGPVETRNRPSHMGRNGSHQSTLSLE